MTASDNPRTDPDGSAPRRFGHYLLLKELGRGAQGVVHLAEDTSLGRKVALKMLLGSGTQSKEVRDRFRREAKITSKLNHPGICGLYEVGEVEGVPYLAMQYVQGTTLAGMLKEARAQMDEQRAVQSISVTGRSSKGEMQDVIRLIERVAMALHAAHEAGLVHRDVKPHNIMVTPDGDPVLLDFGLARDLDTEGQTLTASGQVMGTPAYLAPEQIVADREHIDRRTDVYALGVTLFECVTLQRPYDAPSWDQLYHKILEGAVPNPCKLNPRIPKDLRTVIEVAMEREPKRRYQTASAFADDLQRVRSYEPILASAANLLVRTGKWARRRPGRAATAAVAVVFALAASGTWGYRIWQRHAMVAQHLATAAERLAAGDHAGAQQAVTEAGIWDPDSARAVEMKNEIEASQRAMQQARDREQAFAGAAAARAEGAEHLRAWVQAQDVVAAMAEEVDRRRLAIRVGYASDTECSDFAHREHDLGQLQIEAAQRFVDAQEALERAARLEAPYGNASPLTEKAFAATFMARWRQALRVEDSTLEVVMRKAVEKHDLEGEYRSELLGRGTLTVTVVPGDAEVFLFRCEPYESVRSDHPVPRLVPVPTSGIGRLRADAWHGGFHPGDPCLGVTAVADGSPAAAAGLRAGDLVVGIQGGPGSGVFVRAADAAFAQQGVQPLQRLVALNDVPIDSLFDFATAPAKEGEPDRLQLASLAAAVVGDRKGVEVVPARDLVREPAPAPLELQCLHDGEPVLLQIPANARAGVEVEPSCYPLICAAGNRIAAAATLEVDYGCYLLLIRHPGRQPQRFAVAVPRLGAAIARVELLPAGAAPPDFVWVPPGPFQRGGDGKAFQSTAAAVVELPGFFLGRREVTNRDWYEFVNDPEVRAAIAANPPGWLPRDLDGKVMAEQREDGSWQWKVQDATSADSPVLGVSWLHVSAYLEWRNRRAEARGEPWVYLLPSADEWEKAARGVDGRGFPWGNRFDPSLTVCLYRKPTFLLDAPGGFEPRDESVYGVLDLAGSRDEWTRDRLPDRAAGQQQAVYHKLGGSWGGAVEQAFRAASRGSAGEGRASAQHGFRLVARPRD